MKKVLLITLASLALMLARSSAQTDTFNMSLGQFLAGSGASWRPMSDGGLLQLIADTSLTPTAPTASSFTGNNSNEEVIADILLNGTSNSSGAGYSGSAGFTYWSASVNVANAPATANDYLFLRWFPTITTLSGTGSTAAANGPGAGVSYGQFSSTNDEFTDDSSEIAWEIPSQTGQFDLNFVTQNMIAFNGDPNTNSADTSVTGTSAGEADFSVVPEPTATSLMAGALVIGVLTFRRRK